MPERPPWTQTNKELVINLPLAEGVRGKEISWKLSSTSVAVKVRGEEVLSGTFFLPVKPDDSFWEVEDTKGGGKHVRLGFAKNRCAAREFACALSGSTRSPVVPPSAQAESDVGLLFPGRG